MATDERRDVGICLHEAYKKIRDLEATVERLKIEKKELESEIGYVESKVENALLMLK